MMSSIHTLEFPHYHRQMKQGTKKRKREDDSTYMNAVRVWCFYLFRLLPAARFIDTENK